jgi:transposase
LFSAWIWLPHRSRLEENSQRIFHNDFLISGAERCTPESQISCLDTRMKNRIHMLLMKNNISIAVRDLFGVKGMKCLQQVELPVYHRQQLKSYLTLYGCLNEQIQPLTKRISRLADKDPMAKLLMTIPGIGPLTAMFIIAEIEDISRFPSYRNLSSYAGLVPCLEASADKSRTGRITKQGLPYLRSALVEAAHVIHRMKKTDLKSFFRLHTCSVALRSALSSWASI